MNQGKPAEKHYIELIRWSDEPPVQCKDCPSFWNKGTKDLKGSDRWCLHFDMVSYRAITHCVKGGHYEEVKESIEEIKNKKPTEEESRIINKKRCR